MKILVINPNTSVEMTKTIDSTAKKYAAPGTQITTVKPQDGPDFLANAYLAAVQVPKVLELIEKNKKDYDAHIIACGSDPGLDACRLIAKNVIGMGEAAVMTACAVVSRFSFLRDMTAHLPLVWDRLRALGIDRGRCASARVVGSGKDDEIVKKRHEMRDLYYQVGKQCVEEDGAGALILNCAGMCDLKEYLEGRLNVPVITGVISAVKIAEQLPTS